MATTFARHINNFIENIAEVSRLLEIHEQLTGRTAGYKHKVEVLNKSAIILLVACWEAFIEDLAGSAFDFMLVNATSYTIFPMEVLTRASKDLKDSEDGRKIWKLAEDGWKTILSEHKLILFRRYIGNFNTPKPEKIDDLFQCLLGISRLSQHWHWKSMSSDGSRIKLNSIVELRGSIAHRVVASKSVYKPEVRGYIDFFYRLAVISSNRVADFILRRTKRRPWSRYFYSKTS